MGREERGIVPGWHPWGDWRRPESDFLDWNLWSNWPRLFRRAGVPTIDMYETQKEVVVEADVPGYKPENISIQVTPHTMTMRGKLEASRNEEREDYVLREREFGEFSRTVRFPVEVRAEEARARYKDGVLRVTAPKVNQGGIGARDVPIERE
ncbi:MAG TPA: Hsp20/alpha crystallin family protein [Firmicutes bacterium]|nr:Hsp20/alpha crystallin family protein [Candidatus Fermentithermobacillaceae bacterium]